MFIPVGRCLRKYFSVRMQAFGAIDGKDIQMRFVTEDLSVILTWML